MTLRWFYSRTVRHAGHMIKHVEKYLAAQRDILSAEAIQGVQSGMDNLRQAIQSGAGKDELKAKMTELENVANNKLKPYPNPSWRENIEVLLVAIAVAMGIRTFFLQPFKIPTGSMQPTLFGITSNPDFTRAYPPPPDLRPQPDFEIPNPVTKFFKFWINGIQYKHELAREDGAVTMAEENPSRILLFNLKQKFYLGSDPKPYTIWFPPDNLLRRAGLIMADGRPNPRVFRKGEDIMKIKVVSGDHLFVDRMTYNFRPPKRGEIIVFETRGILAGGMPQDQYYIKRMVAMDGEKVRIGNDRHLVINGKRLDASTPHFEGVYSFDPKEPPRDSQFSGHVNEEVGRSIGIPNLAPLFPDENRPYTVKPDHYMVMGDNTINSFDSRAWGEFPQQNVIGRSFFVYWPIGAQNGRDSRFGVGNR